MDIFKNKILSTLTALYVEDESKISDVVSPLLNKFFKKVFLAQNGQEGIEIYRHNQDKIDIVVTDINMPKMNGLEMCTKIRELNKTIPLVITTAHNDKDFLHQSIDLDVSKFVTKPMNMTFLIESIQKSFEPILLQQELDQQRELHEIERIKSAKFAATGELAAGIIHEINTPLTYIKANFEMLEYDVDDLLDSKVKDNIKNTLEKINGGLHRLENIVGSMREISQKSTMNKEKTNIFSTLVTAAILTYNKIKHISCIYINGKKFSPDMDKNQLTFITNIQRQRIEQVWIIIINNAMDELMKIDDFEKRKLQINVTTDNNDIVVTFKDNAGGIAKGMIPYIFEPFKGTKEFSGMGLGLSIAKKIIEEQGDCTIEAYNEDDGAVFKVTFKNCSHVS